LCQRGLSILTASTLHWVTRLSFEDAALENHINVIYPKTPEATENLERVAKSFQDEKSQKFIKWFIGNGSISARDLETLIPIF
jgi:hypothetical protein